MFEGLDPLDLRTQEEMAEDEAKKQEFELRKEKGDIQWLMSHIAGRRIMWRLLETAGVYRLSFTGDHATTSFKEGARNMGLGLLAKLHMYCPDSYNKMVKECTTEDTKDELADFI